MTQHPHLSTWQLFRIWASIGLQSFGGGASTTLLIQRAFIEKHQLLTMEEFMHSWNLCLLAPGINLVALTILIGRKFGGTWGIIASLAGMLIPSAVITCLLTALFTQIEHITAVQAIVRGVVPATGGILFLVGLNFAVPLMRKGFKDGPLVLLISAAIILTATFTVLFLKFSVAVVILGAALLGAIFLAPHQSSLPPDKEQRGKQ